MQFDIATTIVNVETSTEVDWLSKRGEKKPGI